MASVLFNYTLSTFYNQKVTQIFSLSLEFTFVLNSIFTFPFIYIILTQSSKFKVYKWYLLSSIIWDYTYEILVSLWQPILFFPVFMAYSNGPVQAYLGNRGGIVIFTFMIVFMINMAITQFISFLYRFSIITASENIVEVFETPKKIFLPIFFLAILMYIIGVAPCITWLIFNFALKDFKRIVQEQAPVLEIFLTEPSLIGLPYHRIEPAIARTLAGFLIGWAIVTLCCCVFFHYKLQYWRKIVSTDTYKLQLMLFRALILQVFLGLGLGLGLAWAYKGHSRSDN